MKKSKLKVEEDELTFSSQSGGYDFGGYDFFFVLFQRK
jgi:hypothetical protein